MNQNSSSHTILIVKENPFRIREEKERQKKRLITMSKNVVYGVRRWVAEYCATTAAMNEFLSSLAEELTLQDIKVNTLRSSSTISEKSKSLLWQAGLIVCRCALLRLRCHYGLARLGKSRKVPNDVPFVYKI